MSWLSLPRLGGYGASKAAEWSLTNTLRQQLADQGTRVAGLHVGYMDTDLAARVAGPKLEPADVAQMVVDGIEGGAIEILADDLSARIRSGLAGGAAALYPDFA